jgi:hypothetical protein
VVLSGRQSTSHVVGFPKSETDALENAGSAVFEAIRRAAASAEEKTQLALGVAHKTALQLRTAEERIEKLEAEVQQSQARAHRAERWLHKVAAEIEQRFDNRSENRDERPRQTGPDIYAPKKLKQEEELESMRDLLQSRPANSG